MADAFTIAGDHPALAGHFPGNPVVPGVMILDRVLELAGRSLPQERIRQVVQVKFVSLLRPGERCEILLEPGRNDGIRFLCRCGDRAVAHGLLRSEALT